MKPWTLCLFLGLVVLSLYSIVIYQRNVVTFISRKPFYNEIVLDSSFIDESDDLDVSGDDESMPPRDSINHENNTGPEDISPDDTNQQYNLTAAENLTQVVYSIMDMNITEWRKHRKEIAGSFFEEGTVRGKLLVNADAMGPVMDFAIVGFPKCGTTTMEANLAYLAPMPGDQDICTPVHQTVYYSYVNWPEHFSSNSYPNGTEKLLRGTKCPAIISDGWLKDWSLYLPRTKLIIGIRHPILWFQSFWNMQLLSGGLRYAKNDTTGKLDPYMITVPCFGNHCRNGCPNRQLLCTNRARFHVTLAALGKTSLTPKERELLSPDDPDGGINLESNNITNYIFLYEQEELNEEYVWEELASFLEVNYIPHDRYISSHGTVKSVRKTDFCEDQYDFFRAKMMPRAYELSMWLQGYLIPIAMDKTRPDVIIPNATRFIDLVEMYKYDPCGKLIRQEDGTYIVRNSTLQI